MTTIIRPPQFNRPGTGPTRATHVAVRGRPRADADPRVNRSWQVRLTLGAFLEDWLTDVVRLSVRPKTYVSYRSIVRLHLTPALGQIPLTELRPGEVQAYLNEKVTTGLAPRTVAYDRNVLRQALGHAERTELVGRNVAKLALPPRIPRREVRPLSPEEARTFLAAIVGERHEALYLVALGVGLRQGEILMADRLALLHSMMRLPRRLGVVISLGMVRRDSPSPQEALDQLHLDPVRYQHLMAFMQCIAC